MDLTFGARLRQQREERQITLTTISTRTKIKASLLAALEQDDVSVWPKGLFGRAYLRDYATAIGLDPETLVSEFLALHPEFAYVAPQVEEAEAAARAEAARRGAADKFRRFVSSAFSAVRREPIASDPARGGPFHTGTEPGRNRSRQQLHAPRAGRGAGVRGAARRARRA